MYRITSITDRKGNKKEGKLEELYNRHGLTGDFYYLDMLKDALSEGKEVPCYFDFEDDKMHSLRTSGVQNITEHDNWIRITTRNSIYTFEKVLD